MKKRPPKFSVKGYLASRQKPIHICDKKALKAQAAAIVASAIKKAQQPLPDPLGFNSITKEQFDQFIAFLERPPSELILRSRAQTAVTFLIADLQRRNRRPKE